MDVFDYLIFGGMALLVAVLGAGIFAMFRGGDFGRSWSNKLMRLRVLTQAGVIVILLAAVWWRGQA